MLGSVADLDYVLEQESTRILLGTASAPCIFDQSDEPENVEHGLALQIRGTTAVIRTGTLAGLAIDAAVTVVDTQESGTIAPPTILTRAFLVREVRAADDGNLTTIYLAEP